MALPGAGTNGVGVMEDEYTDVDVDVNVDTDEGTTLLQNDATPAAVLCLPLLIPGLKGLL